MRGRLVILLISIVSLFSYAGAAGIEHEYSLWLSYGGKFQQDEYLSPLLYSGQAIGLSNRWQQAFRRDSDWTHTGEVYVSGALMLNRPKRNVIYNVGLQTGWGADYQFQRLMDVRGFNIALGPYLDLDYSGRFHGSNVNKPYSMDLGLSLCAQLGLSYRFSARRSSYRVRYSVMTSLLGVQYVPDYWESYYELSGSLGDGFAFASLHNKQSVRQTLAMDMQFRRSAWTIGIRHEYVHYEIHNIVMRREEVAVVIGTTFRYSTKIRPYQW